MPNANVYTVNIVIVRYMYNDKAYRCIYREILYNTKKLRLFHGQILKIITLAIRKSCHFNTRVNVRFYLHCRE